MNEERPVCLKCGEKTTRLCAWNDMRQGYIHAFEWECDVAILQARLREAMEIIEGLYTQQAMPDEKFDAHIAEFYKKAAQVLQI